MTATVNALQLRTHASIDAVDAAQWNALAGTDCPFLRHEFLGAMEHSGCAVTATGWRAAHLTLSDGERIVGAAPAYVKDHSWGEFVFDFGWAQAYARNGLRYYPKLVCAAPFSPITAPKLLVQRGPESESLRGQLVAALARQTAAQRLSSAHALFIDAAEQPDFAAQDWLLRRDVQFHWHNAGYRDFDDYLESFTAEKRKKVRRERRRCSDAGIGFEKLDGHGIDAATLRQVHALHAATFHRHGHEPYLNLAFFQELVRTLPDALLFVLARRAGELLAAAVFLRSATTLYGRYWGAVREYHSLHFETCYHQGIEYCIAAGLQRFEPGTQGEHKVSRGFTPVLTWSAHHIADERFRDAIGAFLAREAPAVDEYAAQIAAHVPYRRA